MESIRALRADLGSPFDIQALSRVNYVLRACVVPARLMSGLTTKRASTQKGIHDGLNYCVDLDGWCWVVEMRGRKVEIWEIVSNVRMRAG